MNSLVGKWAQDLKRHLTNKAIHMAMCRQDCSENCQHTPVGGRVDWRKRLGKPCLLKSIPGVRTLRYIPNRNGPTCSPKDVFPRSAQSCTFCKSPKMEITKRASRDLQEVNTFCYDHTR